LRATLRGWREAVGDPEAAVAATLERCSRTEPDLQREMMNALLPLVHTGIDRVGWMKGEEWAEMHRILVAHRLLPAPLELERVFTLRFLERVYGPSAGAAGR
jgi:NitT/TauT family transport system substrate-binding protein